MTGGAGFIGSALVRHLVGRTDHTVINVDKLTYAGHQASLRPVEDSERYHFEKADVANANQVAAILKRYEPDAILHLAAESHVDRSIDGPAAFIETNVQGTYVLLEQARAYWQAIEGEQKERFRFLHVSTDEVYGTLGEEGFFRETTPYDPRSPYSASKASSDHLVRAWHHTYGLPVLITNCSNNYGPYQYPEKLIPVVILNALRQEPIPVYGEGENVRDWLYVNDHVAALMDVWRQGAPGETYNIGGHNEKKNIEVVRAICSTMDELVEPPAGTTHDSLITFVEDRPGHDFRYAIDASKLEHELGWTPDEQFETGLRKTVRWYLENLDWCEAVTEQTYARAPHLPVATGTKQR